LAQFAVFRGIKLILSKNPKVDILSCLVRFKVEIRTNFLDTVFLINSEDGQCSK
jgi:hypothetical protein